MKSIYDKSKLLKTETKESVFKTDEVKPLLIGRTDPLMLTFGFHGSRHVALVTLSIWGPVLIADELVSDPEPETQSAGVAQSHPDMLSVSLLGPVLDPSLLVEVSDGDQLIVVLSAVL